jgi:Tfp pilus assembly protein PilP
MKLTTVILATAITVTAGAAYGQNPDAIDNARSVAKSLQQKQANDSNAALDAAGVPATGAASKPAPGAPAPAVKPAVIPGSHSSSPAPAPAAQATAASPAKAPAKISAAPSGSNQLEHVNVVPGGDDIQIEISSSGAVTPRVSKLSSPARILVELPETVIASSQNKIPVGSGGIKGVRIGMDGKTPPTTSVVVDLEKALAYDVAPGPAGKIVLIVHTQGGAPVEAKSAAPALKTASATTAASKPAAAAPKVAVAKALAAPAPKATPVAVAEQKTTVKPQAKPDTKSVALAKPIAPQAEVPVKSVEPAKPKPEDKKWAMNGKRDPFFSPVVQQQGSGCSTGKKCLEINGINLRGVVKSDNGFIAVVTNNIGKAYFLRENDPVFNGYVVKITGDSVVFQETVQDKLGKTSTHEVVKRIFTPAV